MSDPTKADVNPSDVKSAAASVADGNLSDDELNGVSGGWPSGASLSGLGPATPVKKEKVIDFTGEGNPFRGV